MWAKLLNILLGIWVVAAPAVFTATGAAANNNYITGPLIITFAVTSLWDINDKVRLVNLLTGAWLVLSFLFIAIDAAPLIYSNIICGIGIIIFSLVKGKRKHFYGGGWLSLFQKNPMHIQQANAVD